jgi:hypothetical protein
MQTDRRDEGATLAMAQQRLLDAWREVSSDLRKLAQSLGHASGSCACRGGTTDVLGACACGRSAEPERECLECAVLLHTVAWRIDELLDEAPRVLPAETAASIQCGAIEWTARTDAVRSRIDALVRTFAEIGTVTEEFSEHWGAAHLPVIRRLTNDLLIRCSALDEVLGFPRSSGSRGTSKPSTFPVSVRG